MIRILLLCLGISTTLFSQNKFVLIIPEIDPNYVSLNQFQMMLIQSQFDKEVEANIEVRISEKNKTLVLAEMKNYKLMIGHNTINLYNNFVAVDKKKGEILRKGFKIDEGKFVISTHVSILSDGVMQFSKDSIVRDFIDRGPINTMMPPDGFEFEETPNNFMWEPINPLMQDATFKLFIYEMKEKEKPTEAIAKGNPIFMNMTNFSNQITVVGKGDIPFKRNKMYCWYITMEIGEIELKRSDIKTFKVKKLSNEHNHEPEEPVLIDLSKPQVPK